jgi:hypothetical protein
VGVHYRTKIPFAKAVRWVGAEKHLTTGAAANTVGNWKKRGVPAHVVLRALVRAGRLR